MTEIIFYFGVRDRLNFMARFLAKHIVGNSRRAVLLFDDEDQSQEASKHLWEADRDLFIPNCYANDEDADLTPVVLALTSGGRFPANGSDVLINCTGDIPEGFSSFERLVEVIDNEDESVNAAEKRKDYYQERGYKVQRHDLGGKY